MSTFIEVQNRINSDFLNRDYGAETRRAIQASIRHFERERWPFNETSTALTTSAGQSFVLLPDNFLILDDLRLTVNSADEPLFSRDPQFIRDSNMNNTPGQPVYYALYQNRIEFSLVPDSAYAVPCYYIKQLPTLSADSDTNAWIQGGMEDIIAYHAAMLMWATVIRNDAEAVKYRALRNEAVTDMDAHHVQRRTPNRIKPTQF